MGRSSAMLILGLVAAMLVACDSGSGQKQSEKEHVWKDQTGTIDKAREVETILQRSKEQQQQQEQQ